ncbi:MFS transporter [Nonomuraea sp. NPDC050556]|uniref:MFS transporter n=1 Tax=Nonomuraea sp. NPDC050556 TaxID=3364369 RepID=UPI00378C2C0F
MPTTTSTFPLTALLALATAAFTAVMTELLPAGLLPRMSAALDVSQGQVGFLVTAYAAAAVVVAIPVTAALRGLPRRPVLIVVLVGFALLNAVTAASSWYPLTFAARLLSGVVGGTMWGMLVGYAARMVPVTHRGRAIAIVSAGITVALCLGIPAGTALAGAFGWRAAFWVLSVLALLLVGWVVARVPDFPGEPAEARTPLVRVAKLPGIAVALAVTAAVLLGHQSMYTYLAPFTTYTGFGRTGLVLLVFGIATVAGVWLVGTLVDRHLRATLLSALALVAAALLALPLSTGRPAVLLGAIAIWGLAFGGIPTLLQTALVDAAGPGNADVATAMQTTVYNLGIAAGSLVGGLVLEGAGPAALPWTALPLLAAALLTVTTTHSAYPHTRPTT